jgi:hypothetical protein
VWERKDPVTAGLPEPAFVEFRESAESRISIWWRGDGKLHIGSAGMQRAVDSIWWPRSASLVDGRRAVRRLFSEWGEA